MNVVKCTELVKDIGKASCKKKKKNGLTQAQAWLTEAHKEIREKGKGATKINVVYVMKESRDRDRSKSRGRGRRGKRVGGSDRVGACFVCGKMGHWSKECRRRRKDRQSQETGQL